MTNDEKISRIIKLEIELTSALIGGHKAKENDRFEESRKEMKKLREELDIKEYRQKN